MIVVTGGIVANDAISPVPLPSHPSICQKRWYEMIVVTGGILSRTWSPLLYHFSP